MHVIFTIIVQPDSYLIEAFSASWRHRNSATSDEDGTPGIQPGFLAARA